MGVKLTKWTPTTDLAMLRRMGKLAEELGELTNVAARCIIQGIDEIDPGTGKVNRERLENEIADVQAQCIVTIQALGLDYPRIVDRCIEKQRQMGEWEAMFLNDHA
jgi:NTP pyrophosphatase (non-canonical NTP hydrolase)